MQTLTVDWDTDAWEFATSDEKTVAGELVAGELKARIPSSGQDAEKTLETETYLFREELMEWSKAHMVNTCLDEAKERGFKVAASLSRSRISTSTFQ